MSNAIDTKTMSIHITDGAGRWGKLWTVTLRCVRGYTLHSFTQDSKESAVQAAADTFGTQLPMTVKGGK